MHGTRTSYSTAMSVATGSVAFLTYSENLKFCGPPGTTVTFDISTGNPFTVSLLGLASYATPLTGST